MTAGERPLGERVEPLLAFLPMLESGEGIGEWEGGKADAKGVIHMPWFSFSPEMLRFIRAVSAGGWIRVFDWMAWQEEAATYLKPEKLAEADIETIEKLLTTHVRRDRFHEGHLAAMVENGHLAAIVHRLRDIRAEAG